MRLEQIKKLCTAKKQSKQYEETTYRMGKIYARGLVSRI
jgi:hypothetical protein